MESYDDFRNRLLNLDKPRKHKIRGSLGVYDAYKYYRKNKPKGHKYVLTESQYFSIIRQINILLADKLISGEDITLPHKMGRLELRKTASYIKIDDKGKLVTNLPIDWDKTIKLWYDDREAYKDRILIKVEEKEIFKIYYNRGLADYNNKSYYEFDINRDIKKRLKQRIKEGKIEAMYLDKNRKYG